MKIDFLDFLQLIDNYFYYAISISIFLAFAIRFFGPTILGKNLNLNFSLDENKYKELIVQKKIIYGVYIFFCQIIALLCLYKICDFGAILIDSHDYLTSFFKSGLAVFGLISIFYGWMYAEYRRFNDKYVNLVTQFYSIKKPHIKNSGRTSKVNSRQLAIARELIFLLSEEKKMFVDYNIIYFPLYPSSTINSDNKPTNRTIESHIPALFYFLKKVASKVMHPYLYIYTLCYLFGLKNFVDPWKDIFIQIEMNEKFNALSGLGQFIHETQRKKSGLFELISIINEHHNEAAKSLYLMNLNPNQPDKNTKVIDFPEKLSSSQNSTPA